MTKSLSQPLHLWRRPVSKLLAQQKQDGTTRNAVALLDLHRKQLQHVAYVELMQPYGSDLAESLTRFINEDRSYIEVDGLCWGYYGEGPHGLAKAFALLGIQIGLNEPCMWDLGGWGGEHYGILTRAPMELILCGCAKEEVV